MYKRILIKSVMSQLADGLVEVVHGGEGYAAVLFCGSGTVCLDAAVSSFLPGDGAKVLVANNGAYSTRAVEVCEYYGLPHVDLRLPVDLPVDPSAVRSALAANPEVKLVYTTHHETGTGVLNPIREIGAAAHEFGCRFVVDTTSSYAMVPIDVRRDNVDACMASAQKGIQGMTGLSYIIAERKLIEGSASYPRRSYYCNVYRQHEHFEKTGQMHFTPPVQVIYAARQALAEYFAEGEQAKWERHRALAARVHAGLAALGLHETIDPAFQSQLVVSVDYPDDPAWDFAAVHDYCFERGYTIYPGKIAGTDTFRICTLGALVPDDIDGFFVVLKHALKHIGCEGL